MRGKILVNCILQDTGNRQASEQAVLKRISFQDCFSLPEKDDTEGKVLYTGIVSEQMLCRKAEEKGTEEWTSGQYGILWKWREN